MKTCVVSTLNGGGLEEINDTQSCVFFDEQLAKPFPGIVLTALGVSPESRQYYQRYEYVRKGWYGWIIQAIEEERTRLVFLLNSVGGEGRVMNDLRHISDRVLEKEGEVFAFGGQNLMSAPAFVFTNVPRENRYVMPETDFMLHLGSIGGKTVNDPESRRLLEESFIGKVSPAMIGAAQEKFRIAQETTEDWRIELKGHELEEFGLATVVPDLRQAFHERIGLCQEQYAGTIIEDFFTTPSSTTSQ